jgi:hypothetical protein
MVEDHLPTSWQMLIEKYGRQKVFECLRCGHTLGGSKFLLLMGKKIEPIEMGIRKRRVA